MKTYRHIKLAIASLGIVLALLIGVCGNGTQAQTETKKKPQVGIGLQTNNTTRQHLASQIKLQLRSRGVAFSESEVQTAAKDALNLVQKEKDPLKGIIHIKFKKFTICISWGADRDYCKSQ